MIKRGQKGPERGSRVAAHLENRLSKSVSPARRHASQPGSFRMKNRGSHADQSGGAEDHREVSGTGQQEESDEGEAHADCQRIRFRPMVRIKPDKRLEQRCSELKGQRDQADLGEVSRKDSFKIG